MHKEELQNIIHQGESEAVELKSSTSQLRAAFETLCAFLNGKGGVVLIGVTNDGKIIGQDVTDHTRQEIASHLLKIEPPAQSHIDIKYIKVRDNKFVILMEANLGNHAPYVYDGRPFYRNQSTTTRMPQHRYEQLIVERGQLNHSWEKLDAKHGYDINSLDDKEILRTIEQGVRFNRIPVEATQDSVEDALIRLNLLKNGQLNNAAIALFGTNLFSAYSQCLIKLGRFRGTDNLADFIDNQQIYGNAFKLLSEASNFLMRHLPIASFFQENQFERIDKPALPVLAVREALINAICHREYSDSAGHITVSIFDDRLEIWSYGVLPPQIKIPDLKRKHHSYPRNTLISEVFYDRGLIEKWATGINKMISLCKEADVPEPEFEEYSGGFAVTFKFAEPIGVPIKKPITKIELSPRQEAILAIIKKYEIVNSRQIASELSNPPSERMLQKELKSLKQMGLIDLKGHARTAGWIIKS